MIVIRVQNLNLSAVIERFQAGSTPSMENKSTLNFINTFWEIVLHNVQEHCKANLPKMFVFTASPVHEILSFAGMTKIEAIERQWRIQ